MKLILKITKKEEVGYENKVESWKEESMDEFKMKVNAAVKWTDQIA